MAGLLHQLRAAGLEVTLAPDGLLHVAPRARLTEELRAAIRNRRAELLTALAESAASARLADAEAEALREDFEERAAIVEFDAGRPRAEAQAAAQASIEARLLRWRWPAEEARATAERIARRAADDDRVTCAECRNFRPKAASGGQCAQHRRAGLLTPPVCRELAALAQRCHAFEPVEVPQA